uniref:type I polyketide synthase n=1 Tax=Vallitalea guaymasensis TaxID=1185412 RepID=UPI00272B21A7
RCGVFVGCGNNDYSKLFEVKELNAQGLTGVSSSFLSARISYLLNLKGPCLALDTACSSSLVAIAQACDSLVLETSDIALAGGVYVMTGPSMHIMTSKAGVLSKGGKCFAFDNRADGFVPGEGTGVILLKRLSDAVRDKDNIYGVIRGWGINQDGKTNGITAPSVKSQINLEKEVYNRFNINPETISYVEAHGTGTKLGDPIEVEALKESFGSFTTKKNYCAIGSVKNNIGHLLAGAGVAGVIKILLSLKHRMLPPMINYETINEHITLEESPFYINDKLKSWETNLDNPRRACISSFGLSGTNAHMVIDEYIPANDDLQKYKVNHNEDDNKIFLLSAKNEEQLNEYAKSMKTFIESNKDVDLRDMAYTLQIGREAMEYRLIITADSREALMDGLENYTDNNYSINVLSCHVKRNSDDIILFEEDKDAKELLNTWIKGRNLKKLSELWIKGVDIDWNRIYDSSKPSRISLPAYPFAKESYWVPDTKADTDSNTTRNTLMLEPVWKQKPINYDGLHASYQQHIVMACEIDYLPEGCIPLKSNQDSVDKRYIDYGLQVFERIKDILATKSNDRVLIQILVPNHKEQHIFSGLSGLLKTASLENSKVTGQIIELSSWDDTSVISKIVQENSIHPNDKHIKYNNDKRYVKTWKEIDMTDRNTSIRWKDNGTYLITGGAGGLGILFAEEIARKVKEPVIFLTGRSLLSMKKQNRIKEIEKQGATVIYQQVDISSKRQVNNFIREIEDNYGNIDGILHSAGIIKDNFIIKKQREEILQVLAPKVTGLVNLDKATMSMPMDFFVLFSSGAGAEGNIGQADYSMANAFMDAYSKYRNSLVTTGKRFGKTLSINWPLWKDGGMHVDDDTEQLLKENTGMTAMKTESGINAFYQGLEIGKDQVMVFEGDKSKLERHLKKTLLAEGTFTPVTQDNTLIDTRRLTEKTLYKLKSLLGEITKIGINKIHGDVYLEEYGINSIMITQLNHKLDKIFNDISKTLFYEYQTLDEVNKYLVENYSKECLSWISDEVLHEESTPSVDDANTPDGDDSGDIKDITVANTSSYDVANREPIAIIGMTGRYPKADNLDEYWNNLKEGKDCISEIPKERWDIEGFYIADKEEAVRKGRSYCKTGGFINGFADFDPLFFNISPREAVNIDPQERLFIKSCWELFEDAGYTREQLSQRFNNNIGVFVGITKTGYGFYAPKLWEQEKKVYPHTSFSSAANRISYLMNLHGPSMPIDTMCSSSLTAIHEACEHLYRNECEMAIAGGVNLYLHPLSYIELCGKKMLSVDGCCKSFGKDSNGFVPGEGIGSILLKPLSKAIADDDHIYAVIRGTSINHGGKTNGYTVPNPIAQGELIRKTLDKAGVDARTVSYIEAHGTGTELGDPIEITGLNQAFGGYTKDTHFCSIGSVKSNIGHLEAAAGVAGVTKIVQQMNNKQIAPSLHSQELNPNINFTKTPFVVQQKLGYWKRPTINIDNEEREYPRIAGLSSFGAGGANAHIIIEEYSVDKKEQRVSDKPKVIVLSAKKKTVLNNIVNNLLTYIEQKGLSDYNLDDISYTLQVGREAMEYRLGLIVDSMAELKMKLQDFLDGQDNIENLYTDRAQYHKNSGLTADENISKTVDDCICKGEYGKVLELWVEGSKVDWDKMYDSIKPHRISLPTYPFIKEKYWVPEEDNCEVQPIKEINQDRKTKLHPLLHENTSDFWEQRFSSTFTGQEFFLDHHRVGDSKILPGVAYLEMVRAAVSQAANVTDELIIIKNVVWIQPVIVDDDPVNINIRLYPKDDGEISYEIYSLSSGDNTCDESSELIHSQGTVAISADKETRNIDINRLQETCDKDILSSNQCYETFSLAGMNYKEGHKGIDKVYVGNNEVLAKLVLPSVIQDTCDQYILHPCMMDSALQASIGLMLEDNEKKLTLPFTLEEVKIHNSCTKYMWAYLRNSGKSNLEDSVKKIDIDLCDENGKVCVSMKGYTYRTIKEEKGNIIETENKVETLMFQPIWEEAECGSQEE